MTTTIAEYIPGTAAHEMRREVERTERAAITGEIPCVPVTSEMHRVSVAHTARAMVRRQREMRDRIPA